MTRPSLLDRADLGRTRRAAAALPGPWATVVACLLAPGVLESQAGLVVGDGGARLALEVAVPPGAVAATGGRAAVTPVAGEQALALAAGMAAAVALDGGQGRVWCLLGERALGEGVTWEVAASAAGPALAAVAVLRPDPAGRLARLLALAGWHVAAAAADEPAEVLGALDRVLLHDGPGAVVGSWCGE